jgi:hypothetical protein
VPSSWRSFGVRARLSLSTFLKREKTHLTFDSAPAFVFFWTRKKTTTRECNFGALRFVRALSSETVRNSARTSGRQTKKKEKEAKKEEKKITLLRHIFTPKKRNTHTRARARKIARERGDFVSVVKRRRRVIRRRSAHIFCFARETKYTLCHQNHNQHIFENPRGRERDEQHRERDDDDDRQ